MKCVPTHPISEESAKWGTGEWEIDIFPYAMDLKSPFCYWGYNPTAFDAPARLLKDDRKVEDLVWRAQSFLCVLEDAGMTKRVRLIEGAGYGWGFDNESVESSGETDVQRKIIIKGLEILDVDKEWGERLTLLRELYPEWTFRAAGEN